jgi:hypothetical protein
MAEMLHVLAFTIHQHANKLSTDVAGMMAHNSLPHVLAFSYAAIRLAHGQSNHTMLSGQSTSN